MGVLIKSITQNPQPSAEAPQPTDITSVTVLDCDTEDTLDCELCYHWRKRYFLRHHEAQALEGLLSLRDRELADLKLELSKKQAHIDKLEKKIFRMTSEQAPLSDPDSPIPDAPPHDEPSPDKPSHFPDQPKTGRKRGKQPGSPGHGPRAHEGIPLEDGPVYDIDESCCADCGEQWRTVSNEESYEIEVNVRAFRRKLTRKKYGHFCRAKQRWLTKRGNAPRRLFPHSLYALSFWVFLLVGKFSLHIPVNRLCLLLEQKGLKVSQGTISAGFKRFLSLIRPLIKEIARYSREEKSHWHLDDAGWKVFVPIEGKKNFGWSLWVFKSDDVCLYILSPSRARAVPQSHLKDSLGVVSCDRLQANRKLNEYLRYAFCWVHERRHLRDLFTSYPQLRPLSTEFLLLISSLFKHNKQRLLNDEGSVQHTLAEAALSNTLAKILERTEQCLSDPALHPEMRRVLNGIKTDWDGLHTFFELPSVPPDNNPAERALRGPKVGFKNYYGSGSHWSAEFTAAMFSLNATLALNNVNLESFLSEYLEACSANGGKPPANAASFLPWHRPPPPK
jgi:transposase